MVRIDSHVDDGSWLSPLAGGASVRGRIGDRYATWARPGPVDGPVPSAYGRLVPRSPNPTNALASAPCEYWQWRCCSFPIRTVSHAGQAHHSPNYLEDCEVPTRSDRHKVGVILFDRSDLF